MTDLGEGTVCGLRAEKMFKEYVRPPKADNVCPESTVACSSVTTFDNTICVPLQDREAELCPIT